MSITPTDIIAAVGLTVLFLVLVSILDAYANNHWPGQRPRF